MKRPQTFEEVVAAEDPAERKRMDSVESFEDATLSDPFQRDISVHEDHAGNGEWSVEYFDADRGCYVTIFAGPEAEKRARDYFRALKSK